MKPPLHLTILATLTFIVAASFVSYRVYSSSQEPISSPPVETVHITLPDQTYTISLSDIDKLDTALVVPSLDGVNQTFAYHPQEGVVQVTGTHQDYQLSKADLLKAVADQAQESEITISPPYTLVNIQADAAAHYNLKLNKIYRNPLNLALKDGASLIDLVLEPEFIRSILLPVSLESNVPPDLDKTTLLAYVTSRLTPKQLKYFNADSTYLNTKQAINQRFLGEATPPVLGVDDGPTSFGNLAERYLEVDLSQQKMYFFIGGKLYKEYRVSTGAEYPTPVGEFKVINKAPLAFSNIYQVWMPYWMGFAYAKEVGAYLGLHEIAHDLDEKGKPIYPHGYYIGDMMTGGCVAMEVGEAREIYNLSPVGMLVRVVP